MKNKKNQILLALCMLFTAYVSGQTGYEIKVKINGLKPTDTVFLGHHLGNKKYIKDTSVISPKNEAVFKDTATLDGGIYLIILPNMNYFEVLIDKDQYFSVSTDSSNLIKHLKFEGSEDNKVFNEYQLYMIDKQTNAAKYNKDYERIKHKIDSVELKEKEKKLCNDSLEIIKKKLIETDSLVQNYWTNLIQKNEGTLLASLLKAMKDVEIPKAPEGLSDSAAQMQQYLYYKKHYFDNIDFTDYRLIRTPVLENKIETYFKRAVLFIPDSILHEADALIKKTIIKNPTKSSKEMTKYLLNYFFNKYNDTKIMCMDKIFVYIVEKYYIDPWRVYLYNKQNNKPLFENVPAGAHWAYSDSTFMNKLYDRYYKMKGCLCDQEAIPLSLPDSTGKIISIYSTNSKYTVLYFWDPDCGHCKKIIPEWANIAKKYRKEDVVTIYVCTTSDKKDWSNFISKHKDMLSENSINIIDDTKSQFRVDYDIYSTPVPYILDKDKKIFGKRLGPEQLEEILDKLIENDLKKEKTK